MLIETKLKIEFIVPLATKSYSFIPYTNLFSAFGFPGLGSQWTAQHFKQKYSLQEAGDSLSSNKSVASVLFKVEKWLPHKNSATITIRIRLNIFKTNNMQIWIRLA